MNEEELRVLVARARDAEAPPSQPPRGLVDTARIAARRRRRVVTVGTGAAVAVTIAASVVIPGLLATDGDPRPDEHVAGNHAGELAAHDGPCPSVLPTPMDDAGHGFGTTKPADRAPRFATPDTAWVCQYGAQEAGRANSGGTQWAWSLNHTPRRLDDALLGPVAASLNDISVPDSRPQACTHDLGPRWMLVTSTGGDLTGVMVDGYGCGQVRLTDNPFATAPGDPQDGGTVPGVLTAPGLAGTLQTWWKTSPADVEAGLAPEELRVSCTDNGPQVETTAVTATPAGVVLVVDSTMSKRSYLTYTSDGLSGGDRLDQIPDPATYAFPPGEVTLGCASPPSMDETAVVIINVLDPHGYWRTTTLADYGCAPGPAPFWAVRNGTGPTPADAVDDLLAQFANDVGGTGGDYTAETAPTGYTGAATQTWIGFRDGSPYLSILVTRSRTSYTANPDMLCGQL